MAIDTIKSTAVLDGAISTADLANDIAINTSGAITTTGAFTSKGIDDNADATALTIDSSEKIGIGTVTPSTNLEIKADDNITTTFPVKISNAAGSGFTQIGAYAIDTSAVDLVLKAGTNTGLTVDKDNGWIGVGTSSPDAKVQIKGAVNSAQLILGGTDGRGLKISTFNQGGQNDGTAIYDAQDTESSAVNSHHVFKNGGTETLRIRGDGDLFWHDTPSSSSAGIGFTNITHPSISISGGADTNYRHRIVFVNGNGTVGIISTSGSSTAYGTSSDYRLKENVDYTWDATTRLKQLKPARFNFIADPDTTVDGFLAHEAQSVVPESVTGTHNGMKDEEYEVTPAVLDDDGNITTEAVMGTRSVPDIQGIDQSKLVPLLVKTIQELEARITALEDA